VITSAWRGKIVDAALAELRVEVGG